MRLLCQKLIFDACYCRESRRQIYQQSFSLYISQEHLIFVKFPGRRLGMGFIEVNKWSSFLLEEKDLIHEICCLWFPDIYIPQDRCFTITRRLTNTDFLPRAYSCALLHMCLHYCYVTMDVYSCPVQTYFR